MKYNVIANFELPGENDLPGTYHQVGETIELDEAKAEQLIIEGKIQEIDEAAPQTPNDIKPEETTSEEAATPEAPAETAETAETIQAPDVEPAEDGTTAEGVETPAEPTEPTSEPVPTEGAEAPAASEPTDPAAAPAEEEKKGEGWVGNHSV